jgi:hypothetical protein
MFGIEDTPESLELENMAWPLNLHDIQGMQSVLDGKTKTIFLIQTMQILKTTQTHLKITKTPTTKKFSY